MLGHDAGLLKDCRLPEEACAHFHWQALFSPRYECRLYLSFCSVCSMTVRARRETLFEPNTSHPSYPNNFRCTVSSFSFTRYNRLFPQSDIQTKLGRFIGSRT